MNTVDSDDWMPIVFEWARSVGFSERRGLNGLSYCNGGLCLQVLPNNGVYLNGTSLKNVTTRGNVRLLCKLLGLELKDT